MITTVRWKTTKYENMTYLIPSSAAEFHLREIGKGTTSVMENSRTLKAGDKMAHYKDHEWKEERERDE